MALSSGTIRRTPLDGWQEIGSRYHLGRMDQANMLKTSSIENSTTAVHESAAP
jgi:hypothetical protein